MAGEGDRVVVRMYRGVLGDCFLISFPRQDGSRFHFMIDFGVLLGTSDAEIRMKAVARWAGDRNCMRSTRPKAK